MCHYLEAATQASFHLEGRDQQTSEMGMLKTSSGLAEAGSLNKSSGLAPALGVTKFINMRDIILVTLCCATKVRLRCSTNPPFLLHVRHNSYQSLL
jgi:hypothetical protein